jgi:hypothetical protein
MTGSNGRARGSREDGVHVHRRTAEEIAVEDESACRGWVYGWEVPMESSSQRLRELTFAYLRVSGRTWRLASGWGFGK